MDTIKNNAHKKKKYVIIIIITVLYLFVGFTFNMYGEYFNAKDYGKPSTSILREPETYIRSIIFSPFWPVFVGANLFNYHNLFGYQGGSNNLEVYCSSFGEVCPSNNQCEFCGATKVSSYASCHSKKFCENAPME